MSALDWVVLCVVVGVPSLLALAVSLALDRARRELKFSRELNAAWERHNDRWAAHSQKLLDTLMEQTHRLIEARSHQASPPAPAGETRPEPDGDEGTG